MQWVPNANGGAGGWKNFAENALYDTRGLKVGDSNLTISGDGWGANFAGKKWETHLEMSVAYPRARDMNGVSPRSQDLIDDKYAPRAFGDYARNLSSTFAKVDQGGSYVGSPPRTREKFSADAWARCHSYYGKNSPTPTMSFFLRGDRWESH